jgi:hypothetical protein
LHSSWPSWNNVKNRFRLIFKFNGTRFAHSLRSANRKIADAIRGGVERTILQIHQRLLLIPDGADVKEFILTGGQSVCVPTVQVAAPADTPPPPAPLTLAQLKDRYLSTLSIGSVEQNSLATVPRTSATPSGRHRRRSC